MKLRCRTLYSQPLLDKHCGRVKFKGQVAEVAEAVRFLCLEGREFITGADLPVCGGLAI